MNKLTTYSGKDFDLAQPNASLLSIEDVAHSLSQLCRFTGHCVRFYSVAQHSVLVSMLVPPELAYVGLMHDITESVLGDVASPLKDLLPDYRWLEQRVWLSMAIQYDLPVCMPRGVKYADLQALALEKKHLMPDTGPWAILHGVEVPNLSLYTQTPDEAKRSFLRRYAELRP